MAEVRLSRRAVQDLDAIPKRAVARVVAALERLGDDPGSTALDVKALVGRKPWRLLRVADHRVLFRVAQRGRTVLVARVVDRKQLDGAIGGLPD